MKTLTQSLSRTVHPHFYYLNVSTGIRHGHVRWPDGTPPTPFGCRWCGGEQRSHACQYLRGRGYHNWKQPTQAQILARMKARRAARKAVCRCVEPWEQMPLAPRVDPWRCEADDCSMHDYLLGVWMTPVSAADAMTIFATRTTKGDTHS